MNYSNGVFLVVDKSYGSVQENVAWMKFVWTLKNFKCSYCWNAHTNVSKKWKLKEIIMKLKQLQFLRILLWLTWQMPQQLDYCKTSDNSEKIVSARTVITHNIIFGTSRPILDNSRQFWAEAMEVDQSKIVNKSALGKWGAFWCEKLGYIMWTVKEVYLVW